MVKCIILLLVCGLFLCSCVPIATRAQLDAKMMHARGETLGETYYMGSQDGFHYFRIQYNLGSDDLKLPDNEFQPANQMPFTRNRADWVKCLWHDKQGVFHQVQEMKQK